MALGTVVKCHEIMDLSVTHGKQVHSTLTYLVTRQYLQYLQYDLTARVHREPGVCPPVLRRFICDVALGKGRLLVWVNLTCHQINKPKSGSGVAQIGVSKDTHVSNFSTSYYYIYIYPTISIHPIWEIHRLQPGASCLLFSQGFGMTLRAPDPA